MGEENSKEMKGVNAKLTSWRGETQPTPEIKIALSTAVKIHTPVYIAYNRDGGE